MYILVPWKPVVLVWGLLSAMILFGFVASSVLQGKDPFAPGATITQPPAMKVGAAQAGQPANRSHKVTQNPSPVTPRRSLAADLCAAPFWSRPRVIYRA